MPCVLVSLEEPQEEEEEMEDGGELAQEDVPAPVEERHGELRGEP